MDRYTQSTLQTTASYRPDPTGAVRSDASAFFGFGIITVMIMFIISSLVFILWIASMVSMIKLNSRFKQFLDTYEGTLPRRESEGKVTIDTVTPAGDTEESSDEEVAKQPAGIPYGLLATLGVALVVSLIVIVILEQL